MQSKHSFHLKDLVFLSSDWLKNTLQNRQLALLILTSHDASNLEHIFQNNPKPPSYIKFLVFSYCAWPKTPSWTFYSSDLIRIFTRHVTYNQQSRTHPYKKFRLLQFCARINLTVKNGYFEGSIRKENDQKSTSSCPVSSPKSYP